MKVLIADKFEETGITQLRDAGCTVVVDPGREGEALAHSVRQSGCEALIVRSTKVPRSVLEAGDALKLVIRAGSGYDTIDVAAATELDIRVCNCPGMNSVAVAELTLGLMVALDRRIVDETDDLRHGRWNKKEYSKALGLKGRTLGIVGLGSIGYEVAKRARGFEMKLTYTDPVAKPEIEHELGIERIPLDRLLRESDFITLHVPGGARTARLIGRKEFLMMKPTAFVLNCSRGGVVDEQALGWALQTKTIAGAALDVYELEPGAGDVEFRDPIARESRVYGTHHVGASTEQAQFAIAAEAVRIVREYMVTGRFLNCVNLPEALLTT